jgi:hypothetical protein
VFVTSLSLSSKTEELVIDRDEPGGKFLQQEQGRKLYNNGNSEHVFETNQ